MSEREDDLEQQTIALHFAEAMNKLKKKSVNLPPTGFCYNCEENVTDSKHFCDADCRDDYQKRKRAEKERLY